MMPSRRMVRLLVVVYTLGLVGSWIAVESTAKSDVVFPSPEPLQLSPQAPRGYADPRMVVDVYESDSTWNGTTLFSDWGGNRIVEVNMLGEVVWEYENRVSLNESLVPAEFYERLPPYVRSYVKSIHTVVGDAKILPNDNVLFQLAGQGIYEIDRLGNVVWEHLDWCSTHDMDRLPNGDTLYVSTFCNVVKQVDSEGRVVWSWYAEDHLRDMYRDYVEYGWDWTHMNGAQRLPSGNTLICLRNLDLVVEVNPAGDVVWSFGGGIISHPHNPKILRNGNLLLVDNGNDRIIEVDRATQRIVWKYDQGLNLTAKGDADRLPNGNTMIVDSFNNRIIEATPAGRVVWELRVPDALGGLYKAERIGYVAPMVSPISPRQGTAYASDSFLIDLDYSETDLDTVWYGIYDNTRGVWATENNTYVRHRWRDAITLEATEEGSRQVSLPDGAYTLYVWANSTGYVDEDYFTPVRENLSLLSVSFTVSTKVSRLITYVAIWTGMVAVTALFILTRRRWRAHPR